MAAGEHPRTVAALVQQQRRLSGQRLLAWFVFGLLALNFPLLALWDRRVEAQPALALPWALFALWALLIVVLAIWMEAGPKPD